MRTLLVAFLVLQLPNTFAQDRPCTTLLAAQAKMIADSKQRLATASTSDRATQRRQLELDINTVLGSAEGAGMCLAGQELDSKIRLLIEKGRVDKQVGASSSSSGSTSAVSGGSVPALLGLALESGAVTQTVSASAVTYRSNPAKLISAIAKQYGQHSPANDPGYAFLKHLDLSLTFNTGTTGTASSASGTDLLAKFRQAGEFSARAEIINHRDLFSSAAFDALRKLSTSDASRGFMTAAHSVFDRLSAQPHYVQTRNQRIKEVIDGPATTPTAIQSLLASYFDDLQAALKDDVGFHAALTNFVGTWSEFKREQDATYTHIAKSQILTFEYSFVRPPQMQAQPTVNAGATNIQPAPAGVGTSASPVSPEIHVARLIYADRFIGESEFTLNLSAGFFGQTIPTMRGNFRDIQFSGKLDIPLPELPQAGRSTLTFSGLFMHLHQRPLGVELKINDVAINQPGNLGLFQVKYSLLVGDSGVSIPLSLTVANRTELINEREVRGNVGMTFDLDKLFAKK